MSPVPSHSKGGTQTLRTKVLPGGCQTRCARLERSNLPPRQSRGAPCPGGVVASLRLPSSCTSSYMSRLCKATMISLRCSILMTGRSGCLLVLSLASLWRSFSSAFPYLHACPNTGQLTEGDRAGGHHEWRWASTGTRCRSVSKCCNAATSNGRPLDPPHARARARTPQRIEIRHPEDGTIITNYTGGGRGMRVILRYEISNAAPGGMSSIAISKDGVPVPCINCQPKQTPSTVEVPFWLTPADYALTAIAHDAAGREVAQSRTRFQVELPAFARQVRVLGTSMLWAAMQAGFGPLKCLLACLGVCLYVYTCPGACFWDLRHATSSHGGP